jgi:hypothetical protein
MRSFWRCFPGLPLVSLYGLVFDPSQIETQIGALSSILPAQTQELLSQELHSLLATSSGAPWLWGSYRHAAGAMERIPRHERDHHGAQYRL